MTTLAVVLVCFYYFWTLPSCFLYWIKRRHPFIKYRFPSVTLLLAGCGMISFSKIMMPHFLLEESSFGFTMFCVISDLILQFSWIGFWVVYIYRNFLLRIIYTLNEQKLFPTASGASSDQSSNNGEHTDANDLETNNHDNVTEELTIEQKVDLGRKKIDILKKLSVVVWIFCSLIMIIVHFTTRDTEKHPCGKLTVGYYVTFGLIQLILSLLMYLLNRKLYFLTDEFNIKKELITINGLEFTALLIVLVTAIAAVPERDFLIVEGLTWFFWFGGAHFVLILYPLLLSFINTNPVRKLDSCLDNLEQLLSSPISLTYFKLYLTREHSVENIHLWKEVEKFQRSPKKKRARAIIHNYLSENAPYPFTSPGVENLRKLVLSEEANNGSSYLTNRWLFKEIKDEVFSTMNLHSFHSFLASSTCAILKKEINKQREMRETIDNLWPS